MSTSDDNLEYINYFTPVSATRNEHKHSCLVVLPTELNQLVNIFLAKLQLPFYLIKRTRNTDIACSFTPIIKAFTKENFIKKKNIKKQRKTFSELGKSGNAHDGVEHKSCCGNLLFRWI